MDECETTANENLIFWRSVLSSVPLAVALIKWKERMNQNKTKELKTAQAEAAGEPTKAELERQMEETRESLSQTVQEIKDTVSEQVSSVKETVSGVLDYREQFQNEPMVWSLGALSAGFALGYTLGYAHKNIKGSRKRSEVAAFANTLATELSTVGKTMVMPALSTKIKDLFGFEFADLLEEMGGKKKKNRVPRKKALPKRPSKSAAKKRTETRK
jgi:phage-related protein